MAAGQQKKRLISSSLHEHYRGKKKKKMDSSDYVLNLRSQIYLEWNEGQKKAMAKREQIGITWTDMAPFFESVPRCSSGLADVLCVPGEIYSLNNLMEVLSCEVWATCLSESERKLLTQFLPSGTGAEQAVQLLLSGENHHFGNDFLRWSTLLCSGFLHPDDLLRREQQIRSERNQYCLDLKKYHTNMIKGLKTWKDRWLHCEDPDELWSKPLTKPNERTSPISVGRAKETPQKILIRNGDITKYMSYIKISKTQREAIKNLKHSGDGIHSKSLSRVLGDINSFHVHPYEALLGEEKKRLHEHWLQVVTRDMPVAFEERKEKKLQREQLMKCLEQELIEKRAAITDEAETDKQEISAEEETENGESDADKDILAEENVVSASTNSDHGHKTHNLERIPSLNSHQELSPVALENEAAGEDVLILENDSSVISRFNEKENNAEVLLETETISSPVKELWQTVEPIEENQAPLIDLERNNEHEAGVSNSPLFPLYANLNQDHFLPSFTKVPEILSPYPNEQINQLKQSEMQLLMANQGFPRQFQEQQNIIEQNNARDHQMTNKSIYINGRYPNQELNWLPDNHQFQNNYWSSSANSDGSLFSVLNACRNIPSQSQYNTVNPQQSVEARNFGPNNEIYGYVPHQFKSSSSHEAAATSASTLNVPWMNYQQQQNSGLQDSIGKPFVRRSWNQ
ncbi:uncharacterized protein LOC109825168 isoform X1 [Asparagus officinalis]|uniref:uncharacterized protein LOC109825168 isoform X1 n=1 Tax=Asparagus officinalis TaxID=4686 RepID=UPI00098E049B|nr:uncharacterized protein LOC109825168 isoform X1 [Asparagus officinalis]